MTDSDACLPCLRRTWLLERMGGHLHRQRAALDRILGLSDLELITLLGGAEADQIIAEYASFTRFRAGRMLEVNRAAEITLCCRHADDFPHGLRELEPICPAVVSSWGTAGSLAELLAPGAVAIVGTRRPSSYGVTVAEGLGRELGAAGVTVVSGMAFGIDAAAHTGALAGGGRTIAVLAASPSAAAPSSHGPLHWRINRNGLVLSEFGLGAGSWAWRFQSRNRIIAGLARATVVVEAARHSGSMITVRAADRLGRPIGVIPGAVTSSRSAGTNELLARARAGGRPVAAAHLHVVRDAQDVLDLLFGEGTRQTVPRPGPALSGVEERLLGVIAAGAANVSLLEPDQLAVVSALELKGRVRRGPGGALTLAGG